MHRTVFALALALAVPLFAADLDYRHFPTGRDDQTQWSYPQPSRMVAIGDTHADPMAVISILLHERMINEEGDWVAGDAHLVLVGDLLDGGPNSRFLLDYLFYLARRARAAGGRVHLLYGNHETMVVQGDYFRYVSDEDAAQYADFAPPPKPDEIERSLGEFYERHRILESSKVRKQDITKRLELLETTRCKTGYYRAMTDVENSVYARELSRRNSVVRIGDTFLSHTGFGFWLRHSSEGHIGRVNTTARDKVFATQNHAVGLGPPVDQEHWILRPHDHNPFWGLEMISEKLSMRALRAMLEEHEGVRVVHGHRRTHSRSIETSYDGLVYNIDTGNAAHKEGQLSSLTVHLDGRVETHDGGVIPRLNSLPPGLAKLEMEFIAKRGPVHAPYVPRERGILASCRRALKPKE